MKRVTIAIDGPAAAGKSTVAKRVAQELGFTYIDTGAMYRAFTYCVMKNNLDPKDEKASCSLIPHIEIELLSDGRVICCDEDVTKVIREPHISANVSYIASYKDIRLALVELQRKMAKKHSVVMDGRDIGTYVLPNADVKIYQVASVETRANRRYLESKEKGIDSSLEEITENLKKRDYIDSHRDFAPLQPAADSIILDTSDLTVHQVVNACDKIIKEKMKGKTVI